MTLKNTKSEPAQTEDKCASCGVRRFNHSLQSREHAFVETAGNAPELKIPKYLQSSAKGMLRWRVATLLEQFNCSDIGLCKQIEELAWAFSERTGYFAGVVASSQEATTPPNWTKLPDEQTWYWHWNGEDYSVPHIYSVMVSKTGADRYFVADGQNAPWCDEMGGWWLKIARPNVPSREWQKSRAEPAPSPATLKDTAPLLAEVVTLLLHDGGPGAKDYDASKIAESRRKLQSLARMNCARPGCGEGLPHLYDENCNGFTPPPDLETERIKINEYLRLKGRTMPDDDYAMYEAGWLAARFNVAPSPATKETPPSKEKINMTFVDDKVREHFPSCNYGPHVRAAAELLALECFNGGKRAVIPDVEEVSALVHEQWMESKRAKGVESRKSESGEELMVPYAELSEAAKDLDRGSVKAVLDAMIDLGVR